YHHADAVLGGAGVLPLLAKIFLEELLRDLHVDAGAVTGLPVGVDRPAMPHRLQRRARRLPHLPPRPPRGRPPPRAPTPPPAPRPPPPPPAAAASHRSPRSARRRRHHAPRRDHR